MSLSARRAWIEIDWAKSVFSYLGSLSARRAWIEMALLAVVAASVAAVALRKESVDRNCWRCRTRRPNIPVALRKESVDRNAVAVDRLVYVRQSLSARRAWIEIFRRPPDVLRI